MAILSFLCLFLQTTSVCLTDTGKVIKRNIIKADDSFETGSKHLNNNFSNNNELLEAENDSFATIFPNDLDSTHKSLTELEENEFRFGNTENRNIEFSKSLKENSINSSDASKTAEIKSSKIESESFVTSNDKSPGIWSYLFRLVKRYSEYGTVTITFAILMHYLKSSYVVNPAVCLSFIFLSILADFSRIFRTLFEFILPVYSTLIIFDFGCNFLHILRDSIFTILKKEEIYLSSAKMLCFFIFPFIIVLILACSKTVKENKLHRFAFGAAAVSIAYYSDPLDFISSSLRLLSESPSAGFIINTFSWVGVALTNLTSYIIKKTVLSIIAKIVYVVILYNLLNEICDLVVLKRVEKKK